jgi:hypothetical protein
VLQQRLDARHEHPRAPVSPGRQRRDACRRLVGDELAPLVGERGARIEDGDRRRLPEPCLQLLGDTVADLGIPGDPHDPFVERQRCRKVRLRTVRDADDTGMPPDATHLPRRPDPFADRLERSCRNEEWRQDRQVGKPVARLPRLVAAPLA